MDNLPEEPDNIFEEGSDPDFIQDTENNPQSPEDNSLPIIRYDKTINTDDTFICVYSTDPDQFQDFIGTIIESPDNDSQENVFIIQDENENTYTLLLDENKNVQVQTELGSYPMIDFEKVEEFSMDSLNEIEFSLTKELYQDVSIVMDEVSFKKYSLYEQKEDLITELIAEFKAFGNDYLISHITDITNNFVDMIHTDIKQSHKDFSDILPFIKDMIHTNKVDIPSWIIPIVDNKKIIYLEDDETRDDFNDVVYKDFETSLQEKLQIYNHEDNRDVDYKQLLNHLHTYSQSFENNTRQTYNYTGMYMRACNSESPCHGLFKVYDLELCKTKSAFFIPTFINNESSYEMITPPEKVSMIGLQMFPNTFSDLSLKHNMLPLYDLYHLKYSVVFPYKQRLSKQPIPHIVNDILPPTTDISWKQDVHSYMFEEEIPEDQMGNILKKHLPTQLEIIQSIPESITKYIYSYYDFHIIFSHFKLSYDTLGSESRDYIHNLVDTNCKRFAKEYSKITKKLQPQEINNEGSVLTISDKIKLSWDYISSILIIPYKNNLLSKFINKYSREPTDVEDKNYLYEVSSDNKLLCKHYLYSSKSHNDTNMFHSLKSIFGTPPQEGCIFCNICGEFICPEDFSLFEGFSDGGENVIQSREVIETNTELEEYTHEQLMIKEHITKLSSILGCKLHPLDEKHILDFFDTYSHSELLNYRYRGVNIQEKHPLFQEITANSNISQREKKKLTNDVKEYLENCNYFIILIYLQLFYIQTSLSPYHPHIKSTLPLWKAFGENDSWETIKHKFESYIPISTIDRLLQIFSTIKSSKDPFLQNITRFLSESSRYEQLPSFSEQFYRLSSFVFKHSKIIEQFKNYILRTNNDAEFIKDEWPSFKPSSNNPLVNNIKDKVQQQLSDDSLQPFLLKQKSSYAYENIHSIKSIKTASTTPEYVSLGIPFSEIMKNESYQRLFDFSLHLHGTNQSIQRIDLLIQRFLDTVSISSEIEPLLVKAGWNPSTKTIDTINYSSLREVFTKDIVELFKNKTPEEINVIDTYVHIHTNNWKGIMLNGHSKRNYILTASTIYPTQDISEILEENPQMIELLYSKYCFDENNEIEETQDTQEFMKHLFLNDQGINYVDNCLQKIPMNAESFQNILLYKRSQKMIPEIIHDEFNSDSHILDRLLDFLDNNNFTDFTGELSYPIFNQLREILQGEELLQGDMNATNQFATIFSQMLGYKEEVLQNIQSFFVQSKNESIFPPNQIRRFSLSFGRTFASFTNIMRSFIEDSKHLDNVVKTSYYIIGRLSHSPKDVGTILHDSIPNQWKQTDTNIEHVKRFINENEFLLHDNVYFPFDKKTYHGFNTYKKETIYSTYFTALRNYIQPFIDIDTLLADDNSPFTNEYRNIFLQFLCLVFFQRIITFIEELNDDESIITRNTNELFESLEENTRLTNKETIQLLSRFMLDLCIHHIEEFKDPNWIQQSNYISENLVKQKEREKQNLDESLGQKTDDQRLVSVHLQNAGLENWHGSSGDHNLEYSQSETYSEKTYQNRIAAAKHLFNIDEDTFGEVEENDILQEEEGYNQIDGDMEDRDVDDDDGVGDQSL